MVDTIVTCSLMHMALGAHLFLHNDKLRGAIEFQKPMEAVDPATENSICEAGITHKQDRNDSAKFHERKITFTLNFRLSRIIGDYVCIPTRSGWSLSHQCMPFFVRTDAQVAQMKQSRENAENLFRSLSTGRWFPVKKSTLDAMVPLNFAVDAS